MDSHFSKINNRDKNKKFIKIKIQFKFLKLIQMQNLAIIIIIKIITIIKIIYIKIAIIFCLVIKIVKDRPIIYNQRQAKFMKFISQKTIMIK